MRALRTTSIGVPAIAAARAVDAQSTGSQRTAPTVAPSNVAEPRVSGTPRVGQVLRTTRGQWTGTAPITYEYRWYRCDGAGAPDASDCGRISNAGDNTYSLRQGDAGFRIRSQVIGRNADGQDTATSNPTNVITAARPVNTTEPSISGTARVGSTLEANRGQWAGDQPITYSYVWLRCNDKGENCSEIQGANDTSYEVRDARHRPDASRPCHRAERPRLDVRDLEPDGCRGLEPASAEPGHGRCRWPAAGGGRPTGRRHRCSSRRTR